VPVSKPPAGLDVAVCGKSPLFVQQTVAPGATVSEGGENE
jgi:hypothetical protein